MADIASIRTDRRASAALEFAIVAPVLSFFLFGVLGVGVIGFYQTSLDEAVRDAARQIQIDGPAATSGSNFVAAVCAEFGLVAGDCTTGLSYNVQASTQAAGFASLTPAALSASGAFGNGFFGSGAGFAAGVNVLVQVAYTLPYTLPYVGTLATMTGTNAIATITTVRVEPFQ